MCVCARFFFSFCFWLYCHLKHNLRQQINWDLWAELNSKCKVSSLAVVGMNLLSSMEFFSVYFFSLSPIPFFHIWLVSPFDGGNESPVGIFLVARCIVQDWKPCILLDLFCCGSSRSNWNSKWEWKKNKLLVIAMAMIPAPIGGFIVVEEISGGLIDRKNFQIEYETRYVSRVWYVFCRWHWHWHFISCMSYLEWFS